MKSVFQRICSFSLALFIVLALLPAGIFAAGQQTYETTQTLAHGLELTSTLRRSGTAAESFYMLDYTPASGVVPITAYGSKLYGKSDINTVIRWCEERGHTVMAAVNGDFFDVNTGIPTGMVIQNGRLCVSDGAWNAVGFMPDGSVIVGTPKLTMSVTGPDGIRRPIYALNKVRTPKGMYLYTPDFSSTTRLTAVGVQVLLEVEAGDYLQLGRPLTAVVAAVVHGTEALTIGENQMVLALSDVNTSGTTLTGLEVGQTVTVEASTVDERWHEVVYSCGGGDLLVADGELTAAAAESGKAPRTVLGMREDGSCSILICDGRQSGFADGISLRSAAKQLLAQGCTTVINLDGGGSTIIASRANGSTTVPVISSPSDGSARKCANYIVFVNSGDASLPASGVAVYPQNAPILSGTQASVAAKGYNADYFPADAGAVELVITSGEGSLENGLFTAPTQEGTVTIGAAAGRLEVQEGSFTVYSEPVGMSIVKNGSDAALTRLNLTPGEQIDLDVLCTDGLRRMISQDNLFDFTVSGGAGTVDGNGLFTACRTPGIKGVLTVSCGSKSASVSIAVGRAPDLLEGFEKNTVWTASALGAETSAACTVAQTAEKARYGFGSLTATYHVPAVSLPENITFHAQKVYRLSGSVSAISLMAQGSGSFAVDFGMGDGSIVSVPLGIDPAAGWQYLAVNVPDGAKTLLGLSAAVETAASGSLLVDQIMCHYAAAEADLTPPDVSIVTSDGLFAALISDNYPLPVTADMISLTVDGKALTFEYQEESGELFAALPLDGAMHHIVLEVHDAFFNRAVRHAAVGQVQTSVFADLGASGHWSRPYAEYLCERGIFSVDANFYPDRAATNQMVATLISRYLRLDTGAYSEVELPYADAAEIADWALPHVRALYAEGIMKGTVVGGVSVFLPTAETTRAQVMTVLGRTIERGYQYSEPAFDDFSAVPYWAKDHVSLLCGLEIVAGFGNTNNVAPLETITRGQLASLFFKLY